MDFSQGTSRPSTVQPIHGCNVPLTDHAARAAGSPSTVDLVASILTPQQRAKCGSRRRKALERRREQGTSVGGTARWSYEVLRHGEIRAAQNCAPRMLFDDRELFDHEEDARTAPRLPSALEHDRQPEIEQLNQLGDDDRDAGNVPKDFDPVRMRFSTRATFSIAPDSQLRTARQDAAKDR